MTATTGYSGYSYSLSPRPTHKSIISDIIYYTIPIGSMSSEDKRNIADEAARKIIDVISDLRIEDAYAGYSGYSYDKS